MFGDYLTLWELAPDGEPIVTPHSQLLPVRRHGAPAMLKVAVEAEEKFGGVLMAWWDGQGAARVIAHQGDAILLERAEGNVSLAKLARDGRDDEASQIICATVAKLHAPRDKPLPDLIPLRQWFRELEPAAATHGGILPLAAATARELLATPEKSGCSMATSITTIFSTSGVADGLQSTPSASSANAVSIMPTFSAIPIMKPRPTPVAFSGASKW